MVGLNGVSRLFLTVALIVACYGWGLIVITVDWGL